MHVYIASDINVCICINTNIILLAIFLKAVSSIQIIISGRHVDIYKSSLCIWMEFGTLFRNKSHKTILSLVKERVNLTIRGKRDIFL